MFHKWPEIENTYNKKFIKDYISYNPELEEILYVITEKIHGHNMQLTVSRDSYDIGLRNGTIEEYGNIFEVKKTVNKYFHLITLIQEWLHVYGHEYVNLYGEHFGSGINKGINYGDEKQIRFFGMRVDGIIKSFDFFYGFMCELVYEDLIVPIIRKIATLEEAMDFDVESLVSTIHEFESNEDNIAEGIVITPRKYVYRSPAGHYFVLKKKSEKFAEKSRKRKRIKEPKEVNPVLLKHQDEFSKYLTENRLDNVFSKYGKIEDMKQIGDYIKYLLEDAKKDFLKENDISDINKGDERKIFGIAGKIGAKMLIQRLNE